MCLVGKSVNWLLTNDKELDDLFRLRLRTDFKVTKPRDTRNPPGYFRRLYLDIREEKLIENNLICGGH